MGHHSESDTESTTSQDRRLKRPKNQHRRNPTQHPLSTTRSAALQPNPAQWAQDLTALRPELFQLLQQAVLTEATKRNHTPNEDSNTPGYGFLDNERSPLEPNSGSL